METIFRIFLIIHIISGAVGLLTGILNIIAKKGDSRHKIIGKIFTISMLTVGLSSLVLSTINQSLFMFMVGILQFTWLGQVIVTYT